MKLPITIYDIQDDPLTLNILVVLSVPIFSLSKQRFQSSRERKDSFQRYEI